MSQLGVWFASIRYVHQRLQYVDVAGAAFYVTNTEENWNA